MTPHEAFDIVAPQQLKDVVYERLREALIDLTFEPGAPLREAALTARFGVSKTPIREALVLLERDGLVEIAPYRGARARSYSPDDLRELYEVRGIIESECVRRAAEGLDPDVGRALQRNVDASVAALARGDLVSVAERLDEFDDLLFGQLRNQMLAEVLERLRAHLKRIGRLGASADRFEASVEQHRAVLAAIAGRRPAEAQRLLRRHLDNVLAHQLAALDPALDAQPVADPAADPAPAPAPAARRSRRTPRTR